MKCRYLTFFSYIGTNFRSSEKIWFKDGRNYADPESIQGMIEIALLKLRSLNYPNITLSSRTDGGVHALNASAHFDLDRYGTQIYEPNYILHKLNIFFFKGNTSIFVRKCLRVPENFNARYNAIQRTYLYRLAVLKKGIELPENCTILSYIPIEEWKRCHFIRFPEFDIERFKEGAKHFVGYHDFTTFKKFDKLNQNKQNRREIYSIDVKPGKRLVINYADARDNVFDYWDIEIRGRGFVHNQIRRMVGTLIVVARGKLEQKDIQVMLQVPSKHSWHTCIVPCPAHGLYLCDVEYNPEDLIYDHGSVSRTEQQDIQRDSHSDNE